MLELNFTSTLHKFPNLTRTTSGEKQQQNQLIRLREGSNFFKTLVLRKIKKNFMKLEYFYKLFELRNGQTMKNLKQFLSNYDHVRAISKIYEVQCFSIFKIHS